MSKITRGNYIFLTWIGDHSPPHVHVYAKGKLIVKWDLENQLVAPIESDQAIGLVTVSLEGEPPIERDLFPLESVPEGNLWQRLKDEVLLWFE